jgi:glycosyltransferase involved in cell wall biosynthesis
VAVSSVLAQTFREFEFIVVDDGSTDRTLSIIRSYQDQDKRIVIIPKENTGLAHSLNVGISHAKGRWVARLDADDLCEPGRLEAQLAYADNHPSLVLLGTGCTEINEEGQAIRKHKYPPGHRKLLCHLERLQSFFPHSSALYRADVVRKIGGYNSRFSRSEDHELWLQLVSKGKIACLSKPLVRVRKHSRQISLEDLGRRNIYDGIAAAICHFLRKANFRDPSAGTTESEWTSFMSWVEGRVEDVGIFRTYKAWSDARDIFYSVGSRWKRLFLLGPQLLQSGHACTLAREKCFGNPLPQRLAREWIRRTGAISKASPWATMLLLLCSLLKSSF